LSRRPAGLLHGSAACTTCGRARPCTQLWQQARRRKLRRSHHHTKTLMLYCIVPQLIYVYFNHQVCTPTRGAPSLHPVHRQPVVWLLQPARLAHLLVDWHRSLRSPAAGAPALLSGVLPRHQPEGCLLLAAAFAHLLQQLHAPHRTAPFAAPQPAHPGGDLFHSHPGLRTRLDVNGDFTCSSRTSSTGDLLYRRVRNPNSNTSFVTRVRV
jgi:hypothetical protein